MTRKEKRRLIRNIIITAALIIAIAMIWIGVEKAIYIAEKTDSKCAVRSACLAICKEVKRASISTGEQGTEVYTVEIWEGGQAKITTNQGYIKQISDSTIVVTNKDTDEVIAEIKIAQETEGR